MPDIQGFQCTNCGKCCLEGASELQATEADLILWEEQAPHLLEYVNVYGALGQRTGDLWISPSHKRNTTRCRWIRKRPKQDEYYCQIYEWRPEVCRCYPTSLEHALYTNCPGAKLTRIML
jgi:uncharacterized protein